MTGRFSRRNFIKAAVPVGACAAGGLAAAWHFMRSNGKPNVIVIVADSVRADQLGRRRAGGSITPFLDQLASEGALFTNAYAGSSWTRCSVASLFTGAFTPYHGVTRTATTISGRCDTLAKMLRRHGYATMALLSNNWIAAEVKKSGGRRRDDFSYGFAQGFKHYRQVLPKPTETVAAYAAADVMTDAALELIGRAPQPLFLYIHYMDTHYPWIGARSTPFTGAYTAPGETDLEKVVEENKRLVLSSHWVGATMKPPEGRLEQDKRERLVALTDESLSFVDSQVERLVRGLRKKGALDGTALVFTSDHGQEFWERGQVGHGHTLYNEVVRVPLVIKAPDLARTVVEYPVSTVGLYETVKDICGIEDSALAPLAPSLAPHANGETPAEPQRIYAQLDTFATAQTLRKLVRDGTKAVIVRNLTSEDARKIELYDLAADPGELRDLAAGGAGDPVAAVKTVVQENLALAHRNAIDRPRSSLSWLIKAERAHISPIQAEDAEERKMLEQMKALGYFN